MTLVCRIMTVSAVVTPNGVGDMNPARSVGAFSRFVILRPASLAGRRIYAIVGGGEAPGKCIGPSSDKERPPQDDKILVMTGAPKDS